MNSFASSPSSTLYIPIISPPTPAPSPGPSSPEYPTVLPRYLSHDPAHLSRQEFASLASLNPSLRKEYLAAILNDCTPSELLFISTTITPLLKHDFLRELPPELAIHILGYIDDPRTLARASQVSKHWRTMLSDEWLWRRMCGVFQFQTEAEARAHHDAGADDEGDNGDHEPLKELVQPDVLDVDPASPWLVAVPKRKRLRSTGMATSRPRKQAGSSLNQEELTHASFSYREYFKSSYISS
jgi:F-box and WD-40 domain protein CDC4